MELLATNYSFKGQTDVYRGEARDVYSVDDHLTSIATDRLSVFGHLFTETIPHKGQVLNQLTYFFSEATEDIIPNWIESMPDPNVSFGKRCKRFNINIVIRGSLIGHAWRVYETGMRTICGVELPDGLQEYDLLDEPIITPSTKVQRGYEEDISATDIIAQEIMSEAEYERVSIVARQLFIRGKQIAREQGLLLADTKYEFGTYGDDMYLIDEIHTPDSSRYFYTDEYDNYLKDRSGRPPKDMSKEYIRQWLLQQGYSGLEDQTPPTLSQECIDTISARYIELYEQLTGTDFVYPQSHEDILERIKDNIDATLVKH